MNLDEWIVNGRVGISSKTMWSALKGIEIKTGRDDKPYDPDDFSRCYMLVSECNVSKSDLQKIPKAFPYWKPYIDNWDKLTEMYETNEKDKWVNKNVIGMFEFMQELRKKSDAIRRNCIRQIN